MVSSQSRHRAHRTCAALAATSVALACVGTTARADSLDHIGRGELRGEAKFASGAGNVIYLAAGTLLPLLEDGHAGPQHSIRTADALLTSTVITEALKRITREKRPDGSARTSFPSGHATAAFAVATMQAHYHHKQAPLWYLGAALISESRVQLNRHYLHDVVAGAAVGYFTARYEIKSKHGLLLYPFVRADANGRSSKNDVGFGFSKTF